MDPTSGAPHGSEPEEAAWRLFEMRLAAFVSTLSDPADRLDLRPPGAEDDAVLRIAAGARGPEEAATIAAMITRTVRHDLALPHPSLLTAAASGPAAAGLAVLGLADRWSVGADAVDAPSGGGPADPGAESDLRVRVLDHVRGIDTGAHLDDDGDIRFSYRGLVATHGEIGGYLRVPEHEPVPVIGLFSVLMHSVADPQADAELNRLNRSYRWSRWVRYGEHVVQELAVPAVPFDPVLLDTLTAVFFSDLVHVCVDLADRVGGVLTD